MKLLTICAVFSLCVAVSLAGPTKILIQDDDDSSSSPENSELKVIENDSSSSEEETSMQTITVKDDSSDASEELLEDNKIVGDATTESASEEDQNLINDYVVSRTRRAVFTAHTNNQVNFSKLKRLRRALETNLQARNKRSADTSEENSSEEGNNDKSQVPALAIVKDLENTATKSDAAPAGSVASTNDVRRRRSSADPDSSAEDSSEEKIPAIGLDIAQKHETAAADDKRGADTTSEALRPRRSLEDFDEENQSQDENEVFILSQEKRTDNEETNDDSAVSDKGFETPESSSENKNSEEDYAQGCGGNRSDNSNEEADEKNETLNDNL